MKKSKMEENVLEIKAKINLNEFLICFFLSFFIANLSF